MKYMMVILFGLIGFIIGAAAFFELSDRGLNGEVIGCYDRYHNIIVGQECVVDNSFDTQTGLYVAGVSIWLVLTILFGVIGEMLYIEDYILGGRW